MRKYLAIAAIGLCTVGAANASSGDAWAEFQVEVETGCIAAVDFLTDAVAFVDPFGSESYGFAIVTGETSMGNKASVICVMDKQTRAFEIGGELGVAVEPVASE